MMITTRILMLVCFCGMCVKSKEQKVNDHNKEEDAETYNTAMSTLFPSSSKTKSRDQIHSYVIVDNVNRNSTIQKVQGSTFHTPQLTSPIPTILTTKHSTAFKHNDKSVIDSLKETAHGNIVTKTSIPHLTTTVRPTELTSKPKHMGNPLKTTIITTATPLQTMTRKGTTNLATKFTKSLSVLKTETTPQGLDVHFVVKNIKVTTNKPTLLTRLLHSNMDNVRNNMSTTTAGTIATLPSKSTKHYTNQTTVKSKFNVEKEIIDTKLVSVLSTLPVTTEQRHPATISPILTSIITSTEKVKPLLKSTTQGTSITSEKTKSIVSAKPTVFIVKPSTKSTLPVKESTVITHLTEFNRRTGDPLQEDIKKYTKPSSDHKPESDLIFAHETTMIETEFNHRTGGSSQTYQESIKKTIKPSFDHKTESDHIFTHEKTTTEQTTGGFHIDESGISNTTAYLDIKNSVETSSDNLLDHDEITTTPSDNNMFDTSITSLNNEFEISTMKRDNEDMTTTTRENIMTSHLVTVVLSYNKTLPDNITDNHEINMDTNNTTIDSQIDNETVTECDNTVNDSNNVSTTTVIYENKTTDAFLNPQGWQPDEQEENGVGDIDIDKQVFPTKLFDRNDSLVPDTSDKNNTELVPPNTIATLKPKVKTTIPSDSEINGIEPIKPKPTEHVNNEVGLSTKVTPGVSNIPINTPSVVLSTTEIDSFVISLNPARPKPTVYRKKTTTMVMSFNTIKNEPVPIAPEEIPVPPTKKSTINDPLPVMYVEFTVLMTNVDVCDQKKVFKLKSHLASLLEQDSKSVKVGYKQIIYEPVDVLCSTQFTYGRRRRRYSEKHINVFVEDNAGHYSYPLTDQLATALEHQGTKAFQGSVFQDKVTSIKIHGKKSSSPVVEAKTATIATGVIVAVVVVIVVVILVAGFITLQVYVRWRRRGVKKMRQVSSSARLSGVDTNSLADSIQLQAFVRMESGRFSRRRMERGSFAYVNPGLELLDQKGHSSNPVTFIGLAEMLKEMQDIHDEFLMLPNKLATINDLPPNVDEKNRYSNVIPNPKTRVPLHCLSAKDVKEGADYINANFIRGYQCYPSCYIATQAPLKNTVNDFWRMVWQQNSTVIVMLTAMEEQDVEKCVEYWPNTEGGDTTRVYGDYRISQERQIVMPEWIQTTLLLKYKKAKQEKEINHFWLTSWPKTGLPDYRTLIKFMVQIRPIMDESAGPPIIHCSSGTGRTGVVIALDVCMLSFEDSSTVNVLNIVHQLRKDRGGMVQTKEQYAFIYKLILEYAKMLNNPSSSVRSSISSTASALHRI